MPYDERWLADMLARGPVRLAGGTAPVEPPALSEAAFMQAVLRVAREAGWSFAYHTYRSTKSLGGFPDLILCHREAGHVCYAVELKTDTGSVSQAQQAWLDALAGSTGVMAATWRPSMWQDIVARLRETPP